MRNIEKAKRQLMSLVGIIYNVDDPEFIPILPDDVNVDETLGKLVQELTKYINSKKEIYEEYTEVKQKNHLVVSLINKIVIDVLYKGRDRKQPLFEIIYDKDKKMKEALDNVMKMFKIEKHIEEDLFEALLFGEYYLKNDFQNSQLDDCYEYIDVLPVYARGELTKVFETADQTKSNFYGTEVDPMSMFIISLSLPGERIKLKVYDQSGTRYYIKIPSPFIMPQTLQLLTSIALMEKLIPLNQLSKVDKGSVVNVEVPAGTPVGQMFEITREYEKQLNSRFKIDPHNTNVDDILSMFGRYKVIPRVSSQKSTMDVRDLPRGQDIEANDFEYLVRTLANRLGVPISYIYRGIDEDPKATLLYLLKLQFIRDRISESVKTFLINYINYRRKHGDKSLSLDESALIVKTPAIPGIESLDTVDYADALSATMNNILGLIKEFSSVITEDTTKSLNKAALVEILNLRLEPILVKKVFDIEELQKELKEKSKQPDETPDETEPSPEEPEAGQEEELDQEL